jgi:hypothetical protein
MNKTIWLGIFFMAAFYASCAMAGVITYTYTGNDFTQANSPSSTSDFVSGFFTVTAPLGDSLSAVSISPSTYSFSDGVQTMTNANSSIDYFDISTDGSGNISGWIIWVYQNGIPGEDYIYTATYIPVLTSEATDVGLNAATGEGGDNVSDPGRWTESPSPTPEPSSVALMSIGMLALAFVARTETRTEAAPPTQAGKPKILDPAAKAALGERLREFWRKATAD